MSEQENPLTFLLNVFMKYYKKTHKNCHSHSLFDNISHDGETNQQLELFYQHINDHKASEYVESMKYDKTISGSLVDVYVLYVNNDPVKMADNVIALLIDVVNEYNETDDWEILKIEKE